MKIKKKFKVGNRVKVPHQGNHPGNPDAIGVVIRVDYNGDCEVRFKKFDVKSGSPRNIWIFWPTSLVLAENGLERAIRKAKGETS